MIGRDNSIYTITATVNGLRADDPAQQFEATFDATGVNIFHANENWGLAFESHGYGNATRAVASVELQASANWVEYSRGEIIEWYVNGPLGLEQGWTLNAPPSARSGGPAHPGTVAHWESQTIAGCRSSRNDADARRRHGGDALCRVERA